MLELLLQKIRLLNGDGHKALVVFDLDSTLFDVSPRLEKILLDFADEPENKKRFPEQVKLFKNIKTHRADWGIMNALKRAGLDDAHPEFQIAVKDYWHERFFSNHYLQYDLPYDGAIEFVQTLHGLNVDIAYLTGRDVARMSPGTEQILEKWQFPLDAKAQLVLKPHKSMDDAEFKTDWFVDAQKKNYQHIWFFENEPVNIHALQKKCPAVEIIFFESTHAGKAHPPEDIPKIINFLMKKSEG
jgi:hypothetical protein